jgi:hypothetical protein
MKKWFIVIFVLVSLACGQSVGVVESPKPKRAGIPKAAVEMEIPKRDLCGDVNVRAKPEPTGRVLRWLKAGEKVEVMEERGEWVRIGQQEWIVAEVLCR